MAAAKAHEMVAAMEQTLRGGACIGRFLGSTAGKGFGAMMVRHPHKMWRCQEQCSVEEGFGEAGPLRDHRWRQGRNSEAQETCAAAACRPL